jgi:hypothetical protein
MRPFFNGVLTGLLPSTSLTLTATIPVGTAIVNEHEITKVETTRLLPASRDAYLDLDIHGRYAWRIVANGATAPTVGVNSIRICKLVTDATKIASVIDLRDVIPSIEYGDAAPVAGTYKQGDMVFNDDPDSAEYIGWVCVVAGTPGDWEAFGLIT